MDETIWSSSEYLDKDFARRPQASEGHIDWSSQHGSEQPLWRLLAMSEHGLEQPLWTLLCTTVVSPDMMISMLVLTEDWTFAVVVWQWV